MPRSQKKNQEIRDNTRNRIIKEASLYFARNGFGDTKISDLAKFIGIAQGSIYVYFKSKEELYDEIRREANTEEDIKKLKTLASLPLPYKKKASMLIDSILDALKDDDGFPVRITLSTQLVLENGTSVYDTELYKQTTKIIKQGIKESTAPDIDPNAAADMFWGMIYVYSLRSLFTDDYPLPERRELMRLLIRDNEL
ncbi:MAG: TetR/AcrR family transcriptional regulator [Eubacterium sp.]|nr:TetR/AcrR family transcriptional regulator [Eubacterium sp.]